MKNIDAHSHWLPESYLTKANISGYDYHADIIQQENKKQIVFFKGTKKVNSAPLLSAYYDWQQRFTDMDNRQLHRALVSLHPFTFHYPEPSDYAIRVHQLLNDELAALVKDNPTRLRGLANVPLQDVDLAISELTRAVNELNLSGVQIGTNVSNCYLGEEKFMPFWQKVHELGAFVLIHPRDVAGTEVMQSYYFRNLIGNLLDTTICASSMIFGGVFERFPGLRVCLSHGGGQLPYIAGRLNHGYNVRPECKTIPKQPGDYLNQFYYDTITHSPEALSFLVSVVGADKVVIGTDYPFDMEDCDPVSNISKLSITAGEKDQIYRENLAWLFE